MKKLAALALFVGLVVSVVWFVRSSHPEPVNAPVVASTPPLDDTSAPTPPVVAQPLAALPVDVDAPAASSARKAAIDEREFVTVHATVEDTDGERLGGVELVARSIDGEPSVLSDASGELTLVIPWEIAQTLSPPWCSFEVRGESVATDRRRVEISAPGDVFLGRFELPPGGTLSGRVVDADGAPVEGAYVSIAKPITDWSDRAMLRHGATVGGGFLARTDAEGRYRMGGFPLATFSVAARAPGTFHSFSAPVDVVAGETIQVPDIVLEAAEDAFRIAGVVLTRDGAPNEGCVVSRMSADGGIGAGSRFTDAMGRFEFTVEPGTVWRLRARPSGGTDLIAYDVAAGTLDLVLQPRDASTIVVHVTTSDGTRPDRVFASASIVGDTRALPVTTASATGDEPLELEALDHEFWVDVRAEGYAPFRAGPFPADEPPTEIEATLVRVATWGGVVLADGVPVEGAQVDFHAPTARGQAGRFRSGLFTRFESHGGVHGTTTDSNGRFDVSLDAVRARARNGESVHVHASLDEYARSPTAVVAIEPNAPLAELTLELTRGGSVEGRVVAPEGVDLRGEGIAISQSDGHRFVQELDATGAFRFDHLTPGRWLAVTGAKAELGVSTDRTTEYVLEDAIPWSFEVFEGAVTPFDFEVAADDRKRVRLSGRVLLNGDAPVGWSWSLSNRSNAGHTSSFDPDGGFDAAVDEPGAWNLTLFSPRGSCWWTTVTKRFDLAEGDHTWNFDLPVASLRITGLPPRSVDPMNLGALTGGEAWVGSWKDEREDLRWNALCLCAPDEGLLLPQVPAGTLEFRRNRPFESSSEERTIELLPNEAGSIDLR